MGPRSGRSYSTLRNLGNSARPKNQQNTTMKKSASNKSYLALISGDYDSRNGVS